MNQLQQKQDCQDTLEGKEEWCDEIEETLPQMSDTNTTMMNVTSEMETKLSLQEEAEQKEECNSTKNTKLENPSYKYDDDPIEDDEQIPGIKFVNYHDESQLESVMKLVGKDLSEPYSGMFCLCFVYVSNICIAYDI